jgi:preprotein translocase subunit SecD
MLYFTRWKAAAILLTALFICLMAGPNFFPESTVKSWPTWAQRHVVLGLDLQGGSHILLEVDSAAVRKEMLENLRDDVRRVLREARIGYTGLVVRGNTVEVRIREGQNAQQAAAKLRELSQPLGGLLAATGNRSLDIVNAGDGLYRLTPTEPAIVERIRQASRSGPAEGAARQDREAHVPLGRSDDDPGGCAAWASPTGCGSSLRHPERGTYAVCHSEADHGVG